MASEATAHAPLAPPSVCVSPSRQEIEGAMLQRPFTASGTRRTRLLAVQVHWGEHLDRLSRHSVDAAPDTDAPSTYVALRANRSIARPETSGVSAKKHTHSAEQDYDASEGECYELRSPPFATSRVVERSTHPTWNEMLLVPLPIGWRQQSDASAWRLHVDVVGRDSSQQEDSLLATVEISLASLATEHAPQHLQVELQSLYEHKTSSSDTNSRPRMYLSLSEMDNLETPQEVAEVTVQELLQATALVAESDVSSSRGLLLLSSSPSLPAPTRLREVFHDPHNNNQPETAGSVWISPMARLKPVERGELRLQFQFPMMFHLPQAGDQPTSTLDLIGVHLFTVRRDSESDAAPLFACVASTTMDLRHTQLNGVPAALKAPLQALELQQSADQMQMTLTVRRWNADAWARFQNTSVNRRVITTNRRHRKRAELQALEWTGALCRGLNRYPISSFCDQGGISSLLASYLAASNTPASDAVGQVPGESTNVTTEDRNGNPQLPHELLNQHIRLLQQEVMSKQETIQKIQRELEGQKSALQRCGAELVAARKDVRARDDLVTQLQAKIRERDERDAGQTRELLTGTGGLTGLRLDSQGTQRMNVLIFKYKELEQQHHTTVAELADAKRAAGVYEQLERKYADLEQAHIVQAALVQRLQKDKTHNADLQKTIRMQEKVIRKFETAVHHQRQHQHQQHQSPPRPVAVTSDIPTDVFPTGDDTALYDSPLQMMRVQVLEQQLQVNAKSAASEIGRLKMRIMELETQLSHQGESASEDPKHFQQR